MTEHPSRAEECALVVEEVQRAVTCTRRGRQILEKPTASAKKASSCLPRAIAKAADNMVVHHAGGLHVRVADSAADETKTPALEIL